MRVLLAVLVLAAVCFTRDQVDKVQAELNTRINKSADSLILEWGPPTSTFKYPSGKFVTYTFLYSGNDLLTGEMVQVAADQNKIMGICRIDITANDAGKIVKCTYSGNCLFHE